MFNGANSFRANLSRWCVANVIRYNETTMFNDTQMDLDEYPDTSCPTNYVDTTTLPSPKKANPKKANTAIIIAGSVLTVMVVLTAYLF